MAAPPTPAPESPAPKALLLDAGRRAALRVLERLARNRAALRLTPVGGIRRMAPSTNAVELLATAHDTRMLLDAFVGLSFVRRQVSRTRTTAVIQDAEGIEVSLEIVAEEEVPTRLVFATGDADHLDRLGRRAAERDLRLDAEGLWRGETRIDLGREESLYDALGLPFVPPERREAGAAAFEDLDDLVSMADIRGVIGLHTAEGGPQRGACDAAGLAERAAREGYAWAVVYGPVGPEEVEGSRVLRGALLTIRADGSLADHGQDLDAAELVVAELDGTGPDAPGPETDATAAVVRAVRSGRVDALTLSPGGVLLGRRGPALDETAILDACARMGTALAPSGRPHLRTFDASWYDGARHRGLPLLPLADAHDLDGIDAAIYAIADARRGGWQRDEVLPTLEADAFLAWQRARRRRS